MSRRRRPTLPPIVQTPDIDRATGGEEPFAFGGDADAASGPSSGRSAPGGPASGSEGDADLGVFLVPKTSVEGKNLAECTVIKSLHEYEGRWVDLVKLKGSDARLIRKTIKLNPAMGAKSQEDAYLKQVKNELQLLQKFNSPLIVHHFGSIITDSNEVQIFMEEMDAGSLDNLLPRVGRMQENILARVCLRVTQGLDYLWTTHRAIHRDIKPGNMLVNTRGEIKLCDFGTSRILEGPGVNALTFLGTMHYMSPERLEGQYHAVEGDVFSLGLSLMELATGYPRVPMNRVKYPHPEVAVMRKKGVAGFKIQPKYESKRIAPFDVMKEISSQEITFPGVKEAGFSEGMVALTLSMVVKAPKERASLSVILAHPWTQSAASQIECAEYIKWSLTDPE